MPEMICSHCASEMPEISVFCPSCGRSAAADDGPKAELPHDAILGALAYLTVVPAILFLAIPAIRGRRFVRFHAWQSVLFVVATAIMAGAFRLLFVIFSVLPVLGFLIAWLSSGLGFLAIVFLWGVLVAKAAQGQSYELPVIGPLAARLAEQGHAR
jgi:uncharacterized membrane protein